MCPRATTPGGPRLPGRDDRFFEDYEEGSNYPLGAFTPTEAEIVAFATLYDPQPIHVDLGRDDGVIASGWHTVCLAMRLIADNYLPGAAGLPSPGVDQISWTHPVRPGDTVFVEATVEGARLSNSRPDRGIVTTRFVARNASGDEVMNFRAVSFMLVRDRT